MNKSTASLVYPDGWQMIITFAASGDLNLMNQEVEEFFCNRKLEIYDIQKIELTTHPTVS